jgi:hypothetical protein
MEWPYSSLRHYPRIFLERLGKTTAISVRIVDVWAEI